MLFRSIVDGKATNQENAFNENEKIKDCNPLEKTEKIQRKKITTSDKYTVLSKSNDKTDQINSDL